MLFSGICEYYLTMIIRTSDELRNPFEQRHIEKADVAPELPLEYTDLCDTTEDYYDAADRYMMTVCDMVIAVTIEEEEPDALIYARDKGKPIMYIDANTLEVRQ